MRFLSLCTLISTTILPLAEASADQPLFSKIQMESVFPGFSPTRHAESEESESVVAPESVSKSEQESEGNERLKVAAPIKVDAVSVEPADTNKPELPTSKPELPKGQWVATVSNTNAFALQIQDQQKFALVVVLDGKATISKGEFEISDQRLVLEGDEGTRVSGILSSLKSTQFSLTLGTTELVFKKQ